MDNAKAKGKIAIQNLNFVQFKIWTTKKGIIIIKVRHVDFLYSFIILAKKIKPIIIKGMKSNISLKNKNMLWIR